MAPAVRRATPADAGVIAPLFDLYRQFYRRPPDPGLARRFIGARLERDESVIFIAEDGAGAAIGFVQLYPVFESVAAGRRWVLHDLFVHPDHRRSGAGRALMAAARGLAEETGAVDVVLCTAVDNHDAQALYESLGYVRDDGFLYYELRLRREGDRS